MGRSRAVVVHSQQQQQQQQQEIGHKTSVRIRRALLAGKRGPTTPVPSWKLLENAAYMDKTTVSARKLAATLWELQELPLCSKGGGGTRLSSSSNKSCSASPKLMLPPPSPATPAPHHSAKPTSAKSSDSNRRSYHSRRTSEEMYAASEASHHSFELESSQETVVKPVNNPVNKKSDLLKVLNHLMANEQQQESLRAELEETKEKLKQLEQANKVAKREMRAAAAMAAELEEARRGRSAAEAAWRRAAAEVEEARAAAARAAAEAAREREARRVMEEVCDELAKEIGRDKAEAEELRAATQRARAEVEEERRMLQLAEVWREERVQMKMAEARLEMEEKEAAIGRLRGEMEDFLAARRSGSKSPNAGNPSASPRPSPSAEVGAKGRPREANGSSGDEDLHSIDLNKESLYDRTQGNRWTIASSARQQQCGNKKKKKKKRRSRRLQRSSGSSSSSSSSEEDPRKNTRNWIRSPNVGGRRIETIPENSELYSNNKSTWRRGRRRWQGCESEDEDESSGESEGFSLGFPGGQRRSCDRTPTLSPGAAIATSSIQSPRRNSWSACDSSFRFQDNSLRAKLLEDDQLPVSSRSRK